MMKKTEDLCLKFEKRLRQCLGNVPDFGFELFLVTRSSESGAEMLVIANHGSRKFKITVLLKHCGQPRVARECASALAEARKATGAEYALFCAPFISEKSAELIRSKEAGFLDLSGNLFFSLGHVYVEKAGKRNAFAEKREMQGLFSPRSERVLRVLLSGKREWKIAPLAAEAGVSAGHVYNVKKMLLNLDMLDNQCRGIQLSDPEVLLQKWVSSYSLKYCKTARFYSPKPVPEIEWDLCKTCRLNGISFALTEYSGAKRMIKKVRNESVQALTACSADELKEFPFTPVEREGNIMIVLPRDEGCLYQSRNMDTVRVAAPVQLYLDILHNRGNTDISEQLLAQFIRPAWSRDSPSGQQLTLADFKSI